ncbi:MAG: OmpA family protein [Haliscomenobacter sp.]|nr:OmpA family protein [Haliscomenobacter sp.]MBK8653467.1 OmpA family protein [Haliscomenobacter sp.]
MQLSGYPLCWGLLFMSASLFAQGQKPAGGGLAVRYLWTNYQLPLNQKWSYLDFTYGAELEFRQRLGKKIDLGVPLRLGSALFPRGKTDGFEKGTLASADLQLQFKTAPSGAKWVWFGYSGAGINLEDFERAKWALPVGGGLDIRLSPTVFLSSKMEYRFSQGDFSDHLQASFGFRFVSFPKDQLILVKKKAPASRLDRDGDGVRDGLDLCPDQKGLAALNGCPDADLDGFPDNNDACPTIAGALQGCPDADGDGVADKDDRCPLEVGPPDRQGCPAKDADQDGVLDEEDLCPKEPGPANTKGCPDSDLDGLADKDDDCPELAGLPETRGCPDTDLDGVPDKDDQCPNTPGRGTGSGCPELDPSDAALLEQAKYAIHFLPGVTVRLKPESFQTLDQIVDLMRKYPDFELHIAAYTDNTGDAEANRELSGERAKFCYEYLMSRGIGPRRLSYAGHGEQNPVGNNQTPEGRALNRRMEFTVKPIPN